jgi:phosphatidylglycerophosphate synthase
MTLLERQLHTISEAGLEPREVYIDLPAGDDLPPPLPTDLARRLPLHWQRNPGSLPERLASAVCEAGDEPILAIEADSVIDTRLLRYLGECTGAFAVRGGEGAECTAVLRLEGSVPAVSSAAVRLPEIAEAGLRQGMLRELPLSEIPDYVKKLRRHLPVYLFRITDTASQDRAERFLFWSNYKGSTDFFTKYVYPPLVWRLVRPLAHWRVHPNVVTLFNVGITFAAVPLFAHAQWVLGLLLAYTMSVLDSVDGKLARLTFRASRLGDVLDHGLDMIHPPLWYLAWAWALGNGQFTAPVFQMAMWMTVIYFLDRIVAGVFNFRTGRSIHGYTPFDERMRTFISRRNINVPLFTVGLILGVPIQAFVLIVLWQVVTFLFHTVRLVQSWNGKQALGTTVL